MSDIAEAWALLRKDDSRTSGVVRRRLRPDAPIDVFAAVEKPQNLLSLQIEADAHMALKLLNRDTRGLQLLAETLSPGPRSRVRCTIRLADPEAEDLFEIVVSDLLSAVCLESAVKAAMDALESRLDRWESFFARHGDRGLSPDEQQGLFGELWFVRRLVDQAGYSAVQSWVGPTAANQDFQYRGHGVEVKTTSANPTLEVRISSLLQLDDHGLDDLALVVLQVNRVANSSETLVDMVASVRSLVNRLAPAASLELEEKLFLAGYLDPQSAAYSTMGFSVRRADFYLVHDCFPRLTPADVPDGVGSVRYSVSAAALTPHIVDERYILCWFGGDRGTV